MSELNRRRAIAAGLSLMAFITKADEKYPSRPITLVVPFPVGGSVDLAARQYSDALSRGLGILVIVDNRAGAGGSVGSLAVARAKPDGYTLVVSSQSSHIANPLTQPKLGYDPITDFKNITILVRQPNALVVHPSLPVRSVKEFVEYAEKNPGKLKYGSGGVGSMGQLNVEMLKAITGIYATHIPYRGGTQLITGALANEVQFTLDNLATILPHIQAGKLRALAVAADERLPQMPDVPTLTEAGFPMLNLTSWTGLSAPAGTSDEIVQVLYKAVRQAVETPGFAASLKEKGLVPPEEMPPSAFKAMLSQRLARYGDIVRRVGIKSE